MTQKHHRHVAYCVNAPPITGARIRPMAKQLLHMPRSTGFDFSGDTVRTITKPPLATPDAPIPAMARPAIKVLLFGAKPHTRLPMRKMEKNDTYIHRRGNIELSFPANGVNAHVVSE